MGETTLTPATTTAAAAPEAPTGPTTPAPPADGTARARWVQPFDAGDRSMADLLGGKGAGLAEMTRLGLPVPPGFTVTTQACRHYLATGTEPAGLTDQLATALADLEERTGRGFGDTADPLLLSVRSGARFSMPGMMDTVLDVGLTDATVDGLARRSGERFAWDCYRRLVQMFGRTVLGADGALFEAELSAARERAGVPDDHGLGAEALREVTGRFRGLLREATGRDLPQDPREQLALAVRAVFSSWNSPRARVYRSREGISESLGTAVNVQTMVFGNTGERSGSGVCFTRDPATGAPGVYGDYLPDAQGEDVVAGIRDTVPLARLAELDPASYDQLMRHLATLESHYRDLCDVEFTVEDGRLWVLQTRVGKRTPAAAFRIACQLVDEGVVDLDEALRRVSGEQLESLLHPHFAGGSDHVVLARGLAASPGAAVGEVVLDPARAVERAAGGADVVLVRPETSPDDLAGMVASVAVVTARGGVTSHAAVVARGMGRTCVAGASGLVIDADAGTVTGPDGTVVREGDVVSVDGGSGEVLVGAVPVRPSPVAAALTGTPAADPVVASVLRLLAHADAVARVQVRANADTPADAGTALRLGARGIGLCRTEHMLLGERRALVEAVVLDDDRAAALDGISRHHRADLVEVLRTMDGLPVVVRLLDPPLHEFLPDPEELSVRCALAHERGEPTAELDRRLAAVRRWQEHNPMLGLRGVRLAVVVPEVLEAQVRALADAVLDLVEEGRSPRLEVMVPLVADAAEMRTTRARVEQVLHRRADERGTALPPVPVGSMIELPRAALTADRIAAVSDFFSFGTNDLTQTTWGLSRDDAEASVLPAYRDAGLLAADPFAHLDATGVGRLVEVAAREGRAARPELQLGVCGEHGGDPASVEFFAAVGLDYVSCSPWRVPVARLAAGRAAVLGTGGSDTR
ncbi:pyruvate, phosphate dikinase [Thalassiella azotivora]